MSVLSGAILSIVAIFFWQAIARMVAGKQHQIREENERRKENVEKIDALVKPQLEEIQEAISTSYQVEQEELATNGNTI